MQTIMVIIIVCLAALFLVKTFIRKYGRKNSCNSGCAGCPTADICEDKKKL